MSLRTALNLLAGGAAIEENGAPGDRLTSTPECTKCGACCFSHLATYVRVTGDDYLRLGERAEDLVWFDANRAYLRMVDGHCIALVVKADTGEFLCSAYETRPQTCRDLLRGSGACHGEIHTKGDRPLLALRRAADEKGR